MAQLFLPDEFVVPLGLEGHGFRLEPLGPQHNTADHAAWTSSIDHIRATPGFPDGRWPPVGGLSLAENLRDLKRHADDFERRVGFTYTVLDDGDRVIGCVYIYPSRSEPPCRAGAVLGQRKPRGARCAPARRRRELARGRLAVH